MELQVPMHMYIYTLYIQNIQREAIVKVVDQE